MAETSLLDPSEDSAPEPLRQFEQDLLASSDPATVLQRYRELHPELYETFRELAEAIAVFQASPFQPSTGGPVTQTETPSRFGNYKVVRSIGQGGMGEVYEAIEESLERQVAVKTVRAGRHQGVKLLMRFDRERRTLAHLHHTNIVPIYTTGCEGELLFFTMPYIDGASLDKIVEAVRSPAESGSKLSGSTFEKLFRDDHERTRHDRKESPDGSESEKPSREAADKTTLPHQPSPAYVRAVVRVMATVSEGLHHAHEAGVVHRDLKPSNIMVDIRGHVWVLDFGVAALRGRPGSPAASGATPPLAAIDTLEATGLLGTLPYMSPEQRRDARQADARSDVWGLGVTLYEMLTLKRAFHSGEAVLDTEPIPPRRLTPCLDRDLEAVVLKTLQKDPSRRYATARELAEDLRRWLRTEPVVARPSGPLRRLWLWSRRRPGAAAAATVAGVAVGALAIACVMVVRGELLAAETAARLAGADTRRAWAEAQAAVAETQLARAEADRKERELQLLALKRGRLGQNSNGWSIRILDRLRELAREGRSTELQTEAAAALAGYDARVAKELRFGADAPTVTFSRDGDRLLVSGSDGRVRTWHRSDDTVTTAEPAGVGLFAFSPDEATLQLALAPVDPTQVSLRDVRRSHVPQTFQSPVKGSPVGAYTITPDAGFVGVAAGQSDGGGAIAVWATRPLRHITTVLAEQVTSVTIAPDGTTLAAGTEDGLVRLWSLPDGHPLGALPVSRARITCIRFGPDARRRDGGPPDSRWLLAVGDAGGGVSVWGLHDPVQRSIMRGSEYEVLALAFSPDGMTLASCGRFAAKLWDLATGTELLDLTQGNFLVSLAFSPDGRRLAVGRKAAFNHAGGVDVWELEESRGIQTLRGLDGRVDKLTFSPDGHRVAVLGHDWRVAVWDRREGRLLHLLDAPVGSYASTSSLTFTADGRRLVASAGRAAKLWDLESGAELRSWKLPEGLDDTLVNPHADRLLLARVEAKGGRGGPSPPSNAREFPRVCVIRDLLGAGVERPLAVIEDANLYVHGLLLTPDGAMCILQGRGGTRERPTRFVRVYEASTGRFLWDVPTQQPPDNLGGGMALDPTGRFLGAGLVRNGPSTLFDLDTRRSLGLQSSPIDALAPGARRWVVGPRLFDRDRPDPLITFLFDHGEGASPVFAPDGRSVGWSGPAGSVQVVDLAEVQKRLAGLGLGW